MADGTFLCGVVEGFYGRPWSAAQRGRLFAWMEEGNLNTYLYAPKDDLKHRALWREPYSDHEAAGLGDLIENGRRHGVRFIYSLAPGLDSDFNTAGGLAALRRKVGQIEALGCHGFALLFDDIQPMAADGAVSAGGLDARVQSRFANGLFEELKGRRTDSTLLFCPTCYCGRMAGTVAKSDYLVELGRELHPDIPVLWTGPEIVSETITVESIRAVAEVLRRAPVIWDNLHANDYDLRRIYLGPYSGRPLGLRAEVSGVLVNPNCEFEANFVPVRTFARWARAEDKYEPRLAYREALLEWLPAWKSGIATAPLTIGRSVTSLEWLPARKSRIAPTEVEPPAAMMEANPGLATAAPWTRLPDTVTLSSLELLADCFYLPFEHGARAIQFFTEFQHLLRTPPSAWSDGLSRVGRTCLEVEALFKAMAEMENRELLYALYRHIWELKEELILINHYLEWLQSKPGLGDSFVSAEHRPKTYRGGLVADLQRLLPMNAGGEFTHRPSLLPPHDPSPYR